jgi:tRNA nucleotidyltransferase/poly(A) polymerase
MGRGKRRPSRLTTHGDDHGVRANARDDAAELARVSKHLLALGLKAFAVGGYVRDVLAGHQPDDFDIAVEDVSYDELHTLLAPEGFVQPNIVGGGKLGLRLWEPGGPEEGELVKPLEKEDYRHFQARVSRRGRVFPEVYEGVGRLVGCRLQASWAPPEGLEISLARTESSTAVGRAHFAVATGKELTIHDDLARRDFTVNAMAIDLASGERIDPFGGAQDLKDGVLRVVSPVSFEEDPSRILRGLVRIAKDDLTPDEHTLAQMRTWSHLLPAEPQEQIFLELEKALAAPHAAKALRIARDTGVLSIVLPEFAACVGFAQESQYHSLSCDEHILLALEQAVAADAGPAVRWAALFHDTGKPQSAFRGPDGHLHFYAPARDEPVECPSCLGQVIFHKDGRRELVGGKPLCAHCGDLAFGEAHELIGAENARRALKRLKQAPDDLVQTVELLIREHMYHDDEKQTPFRARKFVKRVGRERVEDLMALRRADRAAKDEQGLRPEWDEQLSRWEELVRQEAQQPLYVRELQISGHDAMAFGFEGPQIGAVLEDLLVQVIADPDSNNRERLLSWLARRAIKARLLSEPDALRVSEELALTVRDR